MFYFVASLLVFFAVFSLDPKTFRGIDEMTRYFDTFRGIDKNNQKFFRIRWMTQWWNSLSLEKTLLLFICSGGQMEQSCDNDEV